MESVRYLFEIIKQHKSNEAIEYLKKYNDMDVNVRDEGNNYLINYAIILNDVDLVAQLIHMGAKLDITDNDGRSILYIPIKFNYAEMLNIMVYFNNTNIGIPLFDIRDKNGNIPLHYAIIHNNLYITKKIIELGSDLNIQDKKGYNALHLAIIHKRPDIIDLILDNDVKINAKTLEGETALHIACNIQDVNIIEKLINKKIDINIQDYNSEFTAMHQIAILGNLHLLKLLLDNDTITVDQNIQDYYGNTPMHYLLSDQHFECVEYMINNKTNYNLNLNLYNVHGEYPIHILLDLLNDDNSNNINKKIIEIFIEKSALNFKNADGNTPLHYLCKNNIWRNYSNILSKKKLNIFAKNNDNERPIDYIKQGNPADLNNFIEIITDSYDYIIKNDKYIWANKWENICKEVINTKNIKNEEYKILSNETFIEKQNVNNINNVDICKKIIREKIIKGIDNINDDVITLSYPLKISDAIIEIKLDNNLEFCTFTGITFDILIGLIYLLKNYSNVCSTLDNSFYYNKELCNYYKSLGFNAETSCKFINFEIVWINKKIYFSDNFMKNFKNCLDKKKFIIIPLGIELDMGSHANYLIYDYITNEIERFEPNGSNSPHKFDYDSNMLDNVLSKIFEGIIYVSPKQYIPKIGFQYFDSLEMNRSKVGDPSGFCALWSIWYTDMRLKYYNIPRKSLVKKILGIIREQNISFKNIIRNYSINIIKIRDSILHKFNITINDFINDNYTKDQLLNIINEIDNLIKN